MPPRPEQALPIDRQLPSLAAALRPPGAVALLQAPPGAGKTTRVPLTLLQELGDQGTLLLIEPRRIAARHAATRLARELGEAVGERVGYRVRLERQVSARTRLEVLTGGLFLRRLQDDPELDGVAAVILDEFHERAADTDLALAFTRQVQQVLRPDLRLLLMSATLETGVLQERLAATLIRSEGRSWPVEVLHQPPRPEERLERQVVRALEQHWLDRPQPQLGDTVLVFLPGRRELLACQRAIEATGWGAMQEVALLHGQLDLEEQSRLLTPPSHGEGRIVLSTAVAESSLTLPGVRLVIDCGLSRRNRFDPASGMDGLVTLPSSQASAEQRRGRAGRLGPGRCVRLWSPAEQQRRAGFDPPELLEVDPAPIALQLARWGSHDGADLPWLDPPPAAALAEARRLLQQLGALDPEGRLTPHGRAMSSLGLHPRLAHMLLLAVRAGDLELGCDLAVLLNESDPLEGRQWGCDLLHRLDWLRGTGSGAATGGRQRALQQVRRQLRQQVREASDALPAGADGELLPPALDARVAVMVSWAYPERVALGRGRGDGRFLMRCGRGARLAPQDPLAQAQALAIAAVDGQGSEARVHLAAMLPVAQLQALAAAAGAWQCRARWDSEQRRVLGERLLRLDALVLERSPWPDPDPEQVAAAMLEGLRQLGLEALPWRERSRALQQRLCLAHRILGEPWPDRSLEVLERDLEGWLAPWLVEMRSQQDLQKLDLEEALWGELSWPQRQELARLLPEALPVPSGRSVRLDYSRGEPVLAVKLQEMFGCDGLPPLLEGQLPITVELLTPAGRAAAITRDLQGFWRQGYGEVRRELRGRYPRHPWPEDPTGATATALSRRALERRSNPGNPNPRV